MTDAPAQRAERLLTHYLRTVWQKAGLTWHEDHDAEIGIVVDAIEEMVAAAVAAHLAEAPHPTATRPHPPAPALPAP